MELEYLGLGDYLVIASSVLGIEAEVLAKASNLVVGDSALNAPAASFGGVEFYPDFATKVAILGYRLARNHALPVPNPLVADRHPRLASTIVQYRVPSSDVASPTPMSLKPG